MEIVDNKKLALYVLSERKKKGISQEQLAWESGLARGALQNIEKGRTPDPRLSTLRKLSKGLKVPLADLAKAVE